MIAEAYTLFDNPLVVENHYRRGKLKEDTFCPRESSFYTPTPGALDWIVKNRERCLTSEILVDHFGRNISSIPTGRTQTQEEALELSIWNPFSTFDISVLRFFENFAFDCHLVPSQ